VIVTVVGAPAPVYSSVAAEIGSSPPKPKAEVCVPPAPAPLPLAVFKLAGEVVQLVPSYSSVAPVTAVLCPPKAKAAVCVPAPPNLFLLYLKD
jgi:hypothetical protein